MKAVIGGKTYNTETATEVGDAYSGGWYGDFGYWEETLYRTKKGRFFTKGSGGPMTRYSVSSGDGWTGSSNVIRAISDAEALRWCENNRVDADVIARYFELEEA